MSGQQERIEGLLREAIEYIRRYGTGSEASSIMEKARELGVTPVKSSPSGA